MDADSSDARATDGAPVEAATHEAAPVEMPVDVPAEVPFSVHHEMAPTVALEFPPAPAGASEQDPAPTPPVPLPPPEILPVVDVDWLRSDMIELICHDFVIGFVGPNIWFRSIKTNIFNTSCGVFN